MHVSAADASGGNTGSVGDGAADVDVDGDTSAILFEFDETISAPDVDPDKDDVQDEFSIDDPDAFIRIDYSAEGNEYDAQDNGDDLDTHGIVTIVSAAFDGNDITEQLRPDAAGNIFLYKASGLSIGEHKMNITVEDEAGNRNAAAHGLTIKITERKPYSLKLNPGWNLVSIPGEPSNAGINMVIPASHPVDTVLTYDPLVPGGWLTAVRGGDGAFTGTLTDLMATRAYWIHTNSFEALKVDIPKPSVGRPILLPTITIAKGWNLIPVLDVDGDREEPGNYLSSLGEDVVAVYTFNTITNVWERVAATTTGETDAATVTTPPQLKIGKGYWVYATKAGTLVP